MTINFNVKVKGGKRTPVSVAVYGTSVNEKVLEFANGRTINESEIAKWIQGELTKALQYIESKPPKEAAS